MSSNMAVDAADRRVPGAFVRSSTIAGRRRVAQVGGICSCGILPVFPRFVPQVVFETCERIRRVVPEWNPEIKLGALALAQTHVHPLDVLLVKVAHHARRPSGQA